MKKLSQMGIAIVVFLILAILSPSLQSFETSTHFIDINEIDDTYQVKEHITIQNYTMETASYVFYLPGYAEEMKVIINNNIQAQPIKQQDTYTLNISDINLTSQEFTIDITYYISSSIIYFEKTFSYDTQSVRITFENTNIYESSFQQKDSTVQLKITKTVPPESFNFYSIILIILLVIIIVVTAWYGFFKKKNGTGRQRRFESTETLVIEKNLLLNVLKEIEKMHRNQKISDDSYHKLKGFYKKQTVDIMSNLDDDTQ